MNDKNFWERQSSSLHRSDSIEFYADKADEHAQLIRAEDRKAGAVDLGCGAGELLEHIQNNVHIEVGLDYSPSMLAAARKRLGDDSLVLMEANVFEYLRDAAHPVWLTTGALNQYLEITQLRSLIGLFQNNTRAESFYLFDCVDPVRYRLMSMGISYRPDQLEKEKVSWYRQVNRFLRRALLALGLISGRFSRDCNYLGSDSMGYGYLPKFWLELGEQLGISVRIVSSRHYEYRYHVIYHKQ